MPRSGAAGDNETEQKIHTADKETPTMTAATAITAAALRDAIQTIAENSASAANDRALAANLAATNIRVDNVNTDADTTSASFDMIFVDKSGCDVYAIEADVVFDENLLPCAVCVVAHNARTGEYIDFAVKEGNVDAALIAEKAMAMLAQ